MFRQQHIDVRRCAWYNPKVGSPLGGGWDTDECDTVLSGEGWTLCECTQLGSYAVLADLVEPPVGRTWRQRVPWLEGTMNAGYAASLVSAIAFAAGVLVRQELRSSTFYALQANYAALYAVALVARWTADSCGSEVLSSNRDLNAILSAAQQYGFVGAASTLLCTSWSTLVAVRTGEVGGRTRAYVLLSNGAALANVGATIFIYRISYGTDPDGFMSYQQMGPKTMALMGVLPSVGVSLSRLFPIYAC